MMAGARVARLAVRVAKVYTLLVKRVMTNAFNAARKTIAI